MEVTETLVMKRVDSEGEKVSLSNDVQLIQCYGVKYCSFKLKRDGKECLVLSLVNAAKGETAEAAALVAVVAVVAVVAKCVIHVSLSLSSAFTLPSVRQRPHFQVS